MQTNWSWREDNLEILMSGSLCLVYEAEGKISCKDRGLKRLAIV